MNICGICFRNIAQINAESGEVAAEGYFVEFVETVCQLEQIKLS